MEISEIKKHEDHSIGIVVRAGRVVFVCMTCSGHPVVYEIKTKKKAGLRTEVKQ